MSTENKTCENENQDIPMIMRLSNADINRMINNANPVKQSTVTVLDTIDQLRQTPKR